MSRPRPETGDRVLAELVRKDAALRADAARALRELLERHGGRVSAAAAALGLSEARSLLAAVSVLDLGEWLAQRWPDRSKGGRPRKQVEPPAEVVTEEPAASAETQGRAPVPVVQVPPPIDYVDARPGSAEVGTLRAWAPRHVWTLHRIPGRLGEVLAVRRRVLGLDAVGMYVEVARGPVRLDDDQLQRDGRARTYGSTRDPDEGDAPGCEVSIWVYDHNPTVEERAAWLRERLLEQDLVKAPPERVYLAIPGDHPGAPDRARPVACERTIGKMYGGRRGDLSLDLRFVPGAGALHQRGQVWHVDLYTLARGEPCTVSWRFAGVDVSARVFLWDEKPSPEVLAQLGAERARRAAEDARFRADPEAFWRAVRGEPAQPPPPPRAAPPRTDPLDALGLDRGATADDVRRAFRRKVASERCHPDQGGDGVRFRELTELRDSALRAVGA